MKRSYQRALATSIALTLPVTFAFAVTALTPVVANATAAPPPLGTVFVTEANNDSGSRAVEISPTGTQTTLHDFGGGITVPAVAVDSSGAAYVAAGIPGDKRLLKIAPDGTQTPIQTGTVSPYGVAIDSAGDVYFDDTEPSGGVFKLAPNGVQTTVPVAGLQTPFGLAVDAAGDLFVVDTDGGKVFEVTPSGTQSTIATGLSFPGGVAVDASGNVYVTTNSIVLKIAPNGAQSTAATGIEGKGVAVDRAGNIYGVGFDDITSTEAVMKVAGDGSRTVIGSGLSGPFGVAVYNGPTNRPPVATNSTRTVAAATSSSITLSASDPDGDALAYSVTSGPLHGTLTGTAPTLTYTPSAGYTGPDSIGYTVDDAKGGTAAATVLITVSAAGTESVSQTVTAGQSVSTGNTPTTGTPVEATVTPSADGTVSIASDPAIPDPPGYAVVGTQVHIDAPPGSVSSPLSVTFSVSASALPAGETAADVAIFRDGVAIGPCASSAGAANPDPCIASRSQAGDTITITVLTSHASAWTVAIAQIPTRLLASAVAIVKSLVSAKVTYRASLTSAVTNARLVGDLIIFALTNGQGRCTAATNSAGVATCSVSVTTVARLILDGGYTATFRGNTDYLSSSARGKVKL